MRKRLSLFLLISLFCGAIALIYYLKKSHETLQLPEDYHHTITRDMRLAAGFKQSLYIDQSGQLWAWGNIHVNGKPSNVPIKIADNVCAVASGESTDTAYYLDCNGNLYGWGDTQYGQMRTISSQSVSKPVLLMQHIKAINAGNDTIYAIDSHGSLWTWGKDNPSRGEDMPGEEQISHTATPHKVLDLVEQISASNTHTLALREDQSLWVWGHNDAGALATGSDISQHRPYKANIIALRSKKIIKLAAKNNASFAITSDGDLYAWGEAHTSLPPANEILLPHRNLPEKIDFIDHVADIALGETSVLVLKTDGTVWIYGRSHLIQDSHGQWVKPTLLMKNAIEIASGPDHALILRADGKLFAWGDNDLGQIGNGKFSPQETLQLVKF